MAVYYEETLQPKKKSCHGNGEDRLALKLCGEAGASMCFTQL